MARDTKALILDAAAKCFAQRGYRGATTKAIAKEAGVNEVTLFRRFKNKAGVLRALCERLVDAQAASLEELDVSKLKPRGALLRLARSEIQRAILDGGLIQRLRFDAQDQPEVASLLSDGLRRNLDALTARFKRLQREGVLRKDVSAEALAHAFFSMTSSFVSFELLASPGEEQSVSDKAFVQLFKVFWDGSTRR